MTDDDKAVAQAIQDILIDTYLYVPWTLDQTFSDMCRKDTVYYLASDDQNQVVGFLATTSVMDEIEITNLAVAKAYQCQGVASLLLKQLISHDGTFFLEVRASNQTAKRLYEKYGFDPYFIRQDYYQNPKENAILMKRES
ncbi:ribosomal protein S18-alanine N-acetyltransferase [Lactococcus piscium]